ncbi:capsule biosynthesis protein [Sphingomonas sp. HMWF008]|nr:capsule biosynthesis protein [Sphingomonas sp. HMWF008]
MSALITLRRAVTDRRIRHRIYAASMVVLGLLCVFPTPYVARAQIVPQDSASIGLSSMMNALGGQLQGFASLLGGAKQPVDLYLAVARSNEVAITVIERLKLAAPDAFGSEAAARRALARRVDVHSLTGGVLEIEARTHDPAEAERLTRAYVAAVTERLNALGRERVTRKRTIVQARYREAADQVTRAEAALMSFRRQNNLAAPEAQLGAELSLRAGLQAQLQAKLVELRTLQQFQGGDNPQLQAVQSQIASLRSQIASSAAPATGVAGPNVAGLSEASGRYLDLYRDYKFAQALYEVYARSSEEVVVEALAAETASDAQIIEQPRLDADRKYNISAVALLALVFGLALFTEAYAPATGIRLRWLEPEPVA